MKNQRLAQWVVSAAFASSAHAAGYRTVGSSGCAAQMVFLPPYTDTAVFLDNYHANFGGPGVDLETGAHSNEPYMQDDGSGLYAFSVEYSWRTNALRKLTPKSNTFCAAGAFFPDGTMLNVAGAETYGGNVDVSKLLDGRQALRRYAPGPCSGGQCTMDYDVDNEGLQSRRWYPTSITLTNGDILIVGGSDVGLLVTNEANINNPTYELIKADGSAAPAQQELEILKITEAENQQAGKSFNLYPILQLLPSEAATNQVFQLVGDRAEVFDYGTNKQVKALPKIPGGPRCFPGSAAAFMLPLEAPDFQPTMVVCGGSSADIPDPQALETCYRIQPNADDAQWVKDDSLPNGGQTMIEPVLLPDGTALLINGAHKGSAGGYMADSPAFQALSYDPTKAAGSRFTKLESSTIPRLYHSVATLLPSGEVLVAGSNPDVFYNPYGNVSINANYPEFGNNGHTSYLHQQQDEDSEYHTEYRVEIYSPAYMDAEARPEITTLPDEISYGQAFVVDVDGLQNAENVVMRLSYSGFHTHAVDMGQRMVGLASQVQGAKVSVTAPRDASVMPPGVYLLWAVADGIPSEGKWVKLAA